MRIVFCSDYWNPRLPDPAYAAEAGAAKELGQDAGLPERADKGAFYRVLAEC